VAFYRAEHMRYGCDIETDTGSVLMLLSMHIPSQQHTQGQPESTGRSHERKQVRSEQHEAAVNVLTFSYVTIKSMRDRNDR
jgi:hypothetical protein